MKYENWTLFDYLQAVEDAAEKSGILLQFLTHYEAYRQIYGVHKALDIVVEELNIQLQ